MRIYFPYKKTDRTGGPAAFANAFLHRRGELEVTDNIDADVDAALLFIHLPENLANRFARRGVKTVLRLDGLYHDPAVDYKSFNKKIFDSIDRADALVFQSEFSRKFVSSYYHLTDKPYAVIHNGINVRNFIPRRLRPINRNVRFIFTANVHPQKRLHEALRLISLWNQPHWRLLVAGGLLKLPPYLDDGLQDKYGDSVFTFRSAVTFLGQQPRTRLTAINRTCHISLATCYRDNCPNVVLEHLACGLPVICDNSGGTAELVGNAGIVIDQGNDDFYPIHYQERWDDIPLLDERAWLKAARTILDQYPTFSRRARKRALKFDITRVVAKYAAFMDTVINGTFSNGLWNEGTTR
jgi:glycosyltransferase involved in cell wall biosynthesis